MTTQKTTTGTKQAKAAAKAGAEAMEQAVEAGKQNFEKATQAGTEAFTTGYEQAVAMTQEQLKSYFPAAAKSFDELAAFSKGNLDAAAKVGAVAAQGFEAIGREFAEYNQKAMETGMDRAAALCNCKTLQDVVELQSEFAREGFDALVAQGTRISAISASVANETAEPINRRVNEAVEKFAKASVA